MMHFHAHIYFNEENRAEARHLAERIKLVDIFQCISLSSKPIGPHPLGMIEAHFNNLSYNLALKWLMNHRGEYSVLIHQDTGDDFKDHTDNILWLGPPLPLNFSFFELIKKNPELQIHSR